MAGTDDGDAVVIADRACRAVGAHGSGHSLADDPPAGHDHRTRAGAATADRIDHPGAVEIAATTAATAFSRRAPRFIGFGLASSRLRLDGLGCFTRAGQRLFVVADAAAGAAGLRQRQTRSNRYREQTCEQCNSYQTWNSVSHNNLFPISRLQNLAAGAIGANRADHAAGFASLAAF